MSPPPPFVLRLIGAGHFLVALVLLPLSLFASYLSVPLVLPGLVWLCVLGLRLLRLRTGLRAQVRNTHLVLLPIAVLLLALGFVSVAAAERSAASGGGLLSPVAWIPVVQGALAGTLSLACLRGVWFGDWFSREEGRAE